MTSVYAVEVGVALTRPPRLDRLSRVVVEADTEAEALDTALLMSACHPGVVMPVSGRVVDILAL